MSRSWLRNGLLVAVVSTFVALAALPAVQAQQSFVHGAVVALQGTPHLWIADDQGVLHWGSDTRALAGKFINWNDRTEVSLEQIRTLPVGDPWLSACGLLKDGDPIYLVKWETDWPQPQLFHIQSIEDVEIFGINASNYGRFVVSVTTCDEWARSYGFSMADLQRGVLPAAVPQPTPTPQPTATATPTPTPIPYDNQLAGLGPLAWWKMQEASGTLRNSGSLTGVDGTPRGTPDYRQPGPSSAIPYGIQLSGNGEDFSVPDVSGLRLTGSYTLLAWIKPDTVAAGNGSIVTKEGNFTGYWLYRNGSRLYTGFKDGTTGPYKSHFSSAVLRVGQWVFVASTWDGTTSRLYLNGAEVSAQALSGSLGSDTNPLTIGSTGLGVDNPGAYFDGTLAQVAVFDKVLTAQDLAALYTAGGP